VAFAWPRRSCRSALWPQRFGAWEGLGKRWKNPGKTWENWGGIWKKWEKLGEKIGGNVELGKTGGKWKKTFVLYHDKWIKYGEMRFVSD
jgi:hypothetical protein